MKELKDVYLAGPGVFREDAVEYGAKLRKVCLEAGVNGLYPLDSALSFVEGTSPSEKGIAIFQGNLRLIRKSKAVIADLTPFRGPNVDDGTAFEIGYAHALGLPVFGYIEDAEMRGAYETKVASLFAGGVTMNMAGNPVDGQGHLVEQFSMTANLMIASAVWEQQIFPTFAGAARMAGWHLASQSACYQAFSSRDVSV